MQLDLIDIKEEADKLKELLKTRKEIVEVCHDKKNDVCPCPFLFFTSSSVVWQKKRLESVWLPSKGDRGIFLAWVNSKHAQKGSIASPAMRTMRRPKPKKAAVEPQVCAKCIQ